jgi:hypothetical protein
LRHPSQGDYQGDKEWVRLLRGKEGVFGIGTADGDGEQHGGLIAFQPKRHSQCFLGLRFSWYSLADGDRAYRPLPIQVTLGPDLARPLHDVWEIIETHAERLDRVCRRLARVRFEIVTEDGESSLHAMMPLEGGDSLRAILRTKTVEYFVIRKDNWLLSDCQEPRVDRGMYLMLAALADGD